MNNDADIGALRIDPNSSNVDGTPTSRASFTFDPSLFTNNMNSAQAEGFRALRTQLVGEHIQTGRRALAICGASPGVGCSHVATNLAIAFSQIGIRTLLIDADLRRPAASQLIRVDRPVVGLLECLTSSSPNFNDFITGDVQPNLSLMYSSVSESPQELLAGPRFRALLDFCLRDFDMTVVDTPPANNSADSRLIASLVGYSLLVARRNKSFVSDVKTLSSELDTAGVRLIGTVLNEW